MSLLKEVKEKKSTYTVRDIFTYTGVSRFRIAWRLVAFVMLQFFNKRYVTVRVNNYLMKLDLNTPGLSKVLYIYGTRELPDTFALKQVMRPGMTIADVGANIGYYALMEAEAVGSKGKVYAFEPDPRNQGLLQENITLNDLEERVIYEPIAISDTIDQKTFKLAERTNVSGFGSAHAAVDTVMVDTIPLAMHPAINYIDGIRMDIEGYECHVIRGLMEHLQKSQKSFFIALEIHSEAYDKGEYDFINVVKELFETGFTFSYIISGTNFREEFTARGYEPEGCWIETKHPRNLYKNLDNNDAFEFLENGMIRSAIIERKSN